MVLRTPGVIDLFRSAGVCGLGEKASGPGELASQTLGHHPAGRASARACGPQGKQGLNPGVRLRSPGPVRAEGSSKVAEGGLLALEGYWCPGKGNLPSRNSFVPSVLTLSHFPPKLGIT